MSTPWEWHQRELEKTAMLAEGAATEDYLTASPECCAMWFLAQFDGLRSLVAICAAADLPVLLVQSDGEA